MEEGNRQPKRVLLFSLFLISFSQAAKADLIGTIFSVGNILFGIAAGLAALMIVLHAIKWKTAGSGQDREDAKRGMINVVLGLALIAIAGAVITTLFIKPESIRTRNNTDTTSPYTTTTSGSGTTSPSSFGSTTSSSTVSYVTTTTEPPISNGECYNAENGNLCTGLDFVYGAGTRTTCCNTYHCCCNPVTPGRCNP